MLITSNQNARIKRLRSLLTQKQARLEENAFVAEGVRLIEDAIASGQKPDFVIFDRTLSERGFALLSHMPGIEIHEVPVNLMGKIADTENPQGILAVIPQKPLEIPHQLNFVLVIDNLRDPGNLGSLLRSAAAAGVQLVLLAPGTTDGYAPKVLRAGMGAHFRLPVVSAGWQQIENICCQARPPLEVLLAEAGAGISCWSQDLKKPLALIIGGEAEGASEHGRRLAGKHVTIPMPGASESLNAAAAGSILLFEIVRQRTT